MILKIFLLSFGLFFLNPSDDLELVRSKYFKANSEEGSLAFEKAANSCASNESICLAYKGASLAMKAGFSNGLMDRFSLFTDGKKKIEQAVTVDPKNPEIRFIRYCIQANVPSILFYSDKLEEDYEMVINHLTTCTVDIMFWIDAAEAMKASERTDTEQKNELTRLINQLKSGKGNSRG